MKHVAKLAMIFLVILPYVSMKIYAAVTVLAAAHGTAL